MSRKFLPAAFAAALMLTACGGSGSEDSGAEASDPPVTSSPEASAGQSAAVETSNKCTDAKGDATTNDLTSVNLRRDGDFLEVTWTMVKRDTDPGTGGFYLVVASEDGSAAGQLGVQYQDGRQISYFTYRSGGMNKEINAAAAVTPTTVTGQFPMAELEQYGPNFKWSATTTRDGNDVDDCPDDSGDWKNPATLRFAG